MCGVCSAATQNHNLSLYTPNRNGNRTMGNVRSDLRRFGLTDSPMCPCEEEEEEEQQQTTDHLIFR
jgi:hypothetical protein